MKALLWFINVMLLMVLATGCQCQKKPVSKTDEPRQTDIVPSSMVITLDSTQVNQKINKEGTAIIHQGPGQTKIDSIKAVKNKLKTK